MVSPVLKEIREYEAAQHVRARIEQLHEAQQNRVLVIATDDMAALEKHLEEETENGLEA